MLFSSCKQSITSLSLLVGTIVSTKTSIIALKASGRDCTNNNELLHKIGVSQRYDMRLFVITSEILQAIRWRSKITVVLKESETKVEGSSPSKTFFYFLFFAFAKKQEFFAIYMFAEKSMI